MKSFKKSYFDNINGYVPKIGCCPICFTRPVAPNSWIKYHISYSPQQVIYACKYCNWIENLLRNKKNIPIRQYERSLLVKKYQLKFKIIL